ncbi:MAG TPA: type II toxin-antitoxin system RelE/ParE family toxin [Bacteroidia bacterium]|jgi:hypothetical protein|nr:type II toxin-antitoxin system RelE/ParE family toxin [Bacteroidia bacterium]
MKRFYKVLLHPEAETEYLKSIEWYEDALPGLGNDFIHEVKVILEYIASKPYSFQIKKWNLREASLKKFPYVIVYKLDVLNNYILVLSVFHTSRNPKKKFTRKLKP